jgi:hypothetical protein
VLILSPLSRSAGEASLGEETDCGLRDATFLSAMEASINTPFALRVARQGEVEALPALQLCG